MFGHVFYRFSINIGAQELLKIYSGQVKRVRVTTDNGLVLDIDAERLKYFTTRSGIKGYFQLTTTRENKFVSLEKIN